MLHIGIEKKRRGREDGGGGAFQVEVVRDEDEVDVVHVRRMTHAKGLPLFLVLLSPFSFSHTCFLPLPSPDIGLNLSRHGRMMDHFWESLAAAYTEPVRAREGRSPFPSSSLQTNYTSLVAGKGEVERRGGIPFRRGKKKRGREQLAPGVPNKNEISPYERHAMFFLVKDLHRQCQCCALLSCFSAHMR